MAANTVNAQNNDGVIVDVKTSLGDIKILLYNDTPIHRDNFVKNVKDSVYNGTIFHRVIKDFMVQGGDPKSKDATANAMLGAGDLGTTLPAEIVYPKHFHKYGALAAARTNNPQKRSSDCQFYIVTGQKFTEQSISKRVLDTVRKGFIQEQMKERDAELRKIYKEQGRDSVNVEIEKIIKAATEAIPAASQNIIEAYSTLGGTPHLDLEYTVYGEVLEGMDVVEKIQNVETSGADRPVEDVRIISMKLEE